MEKMRKKAEMENQRYAILDRALKDAQLKERTERQVAAKKRTETLSRLQTLMSEINLQGQDKEEFDFVKAGLSRIADMITQSSSSSDEDTTKEEENPRTPSNSTEETRPRPANLRVERLKMEERGVTTSTKKKKKHKYFSSPVVRKLRMELEEQRGRAEVRSWLCHSKNITRKSTLEHRYYSLIRFKSCHFFFLCQLCHSFVLQEKHSIINTRT
jgi:hypothetical protein